MTLDLYYFDGRELRKEMSILSDAPSIEIKDVDNDGKNEIIAKMRGNSVLFMLIDSHIYKLPSGGSSIGGNFFIFDNFAFDQ